MRPARRLTVIVLIGATLTSARVASPVDIRDPSTTSRVFRGVACRQPIPMGFCRIVVDGLPKHLERAMSRYRVEYPTRWNGCFGPNCHWLP